MSDAKKFIKDIENTVKEAGTAAKDTVKRIADSAPAQTIARKSIEVTGAAIQKTSEVTKAAVQKSTDIKNVAVQKGTEVKDTAVKKSKEVKENVKKAASDTATVVKKTAKKAAKRPIKVTVKLQYAGKEIDYNDLVKTAAQLSKKSLKKQPKNLELYIKPEENKCYYVAENNTIQGEFVI
ncbi:MAG: hypothetical protein HUJ73_07295 [Eubacterium sp.]|nr:hypothetical protein [Eubacterium sp.]